MKKPSPTIVIATGLVMLSCAIALMGDFFFSYFSDPRAEVQVQRKRVADTAAVAIVEMLSRGETDRLQQYIERLVDTDSDLQSVGIRKTDGQLMVASRQHYQFAPGGTDSSGKETVATVPINTAAGTWGQVELVFTPSAGGLSAFLMTNPALTFFLCVAVFGFVTFSLYMKRVLQQFDPNAAIPERVRAAFDAMTEGVVIVDPAGRIAMANNKFGLLCDIPQNSLTAEPLSQLQWLTKKLPGRVNEHPWHRCMRTQQSIIGAELLTDPDNPDDERIIVNCAPIIDSRKTVRGCMVTFDNITELHRANQRLENALEDLRSSRSEVEQKAADLQRLASVDYLTGVLNRRAFTEQASDLFEVARLQRHVFSCIMIDIDHFKSINDTYGHGVGDLVIQALADVLTANTRDEDKVGRLGGEEFCIALPNTGRESATETANRIRQAVESRLHTRWTHSTAEPSRPALALPSTGSITGPSRI